MNLKYSQVSLSYTLAGELPSTGGKIGHKVQVLGTAFIEAAMERPAKPDKTSSSIDYDIWANWNKLTQASKLSYAVRKYVKDVGGLSPEFEFM